MSGLHRPITRLALVAAFAALLNVGCPSSAPPSSVTVPGCIGLTEVAAEASLAAAGLEIGAVTRESHATAAPGTVTGQSPAAGTSVSRGSAVALVVSEGAEPVAVPNVVGMTEAQAGASLATAGLDVGALTHEFHATAAPGTVTGQSPAAGTSVSRGSAVALVVSEGAEPVVVPDVVGMAEAQAEASLAAAGLDVGAVTHEFHATAAPGTVTGQSPAAGTSVALNSPVDLVTSMGPEPVLEAAFSVRTPGSHAPLYAVFSDESTHARHEPILTWHWTFGDGATSSAPAPVHRYSVPGEYTPSVTVTTASGEFQTVAYDGVIEVFPGADSDGDGIADADELELGTDPFLWDSDGDGLGDGDEWVGGTDPLTPAGVLTEDTLVLGGATELEILGVYGDTLVLFHRERPLEPPGITPGMTVLTTVDIPLGTSAKGSGEPWEITRGLIGEVSAVDVTAVRAGEAMVFDGVTLKSHAPDAGVLYAIHLITRPIVHAFSSFSADWSERFAFNTDDPVLFPEGSPLRGCKLYDEDGVTVTVTDGVIVYNPNLDISLAIQNSALHDARFTATGPFHIALDLEVVAKSGLRRESGNLELARKIIPLGKIPAVVDFQLNAQLVAALNAEATVAAGFNSTSPMTIGGRYYLDELHNLSSISLQGVAHTPTFEIDGDGAVTLLVKPKMDIHLYGQAGMYLELGPYMEFEAHYPCPPRPTFDVGVDATVGVYTKLFGLLHTNPRSSWPDPPFSYSLWTSPTCAFLGIPPEADFEATPVSGGVPLTVQFRDQSDPGSADEITHWRWSFGDGNASTRQDPSHVYLTPGVYTVSLTVESESGTHTHTRERLVRVTPVSQRPGVDFSASPVSGMGPLTVQFTDLTTTDGAAVIWRGWDFDGDGLVDSNEPNPSHTYDAPGLYSVTLQVETSGGLDAKTRHGLVRVWTVVSAPPGFAQVPAGIFEMGRPYPWDFSWSYLERKDELPVHSVYLDAYAIGKYTVTNQEYVAVLNWANDRGYLADAEGRPYADGCVYAYGQPIVDTESSRGKSSIVYANGRFAAGSREGYEEHMFPMADHPVVYVSWHGAVAYCNWRSMMDGRDPVYDTSTWRRYDPLPNGYRLPTEAEWERAAAWDGERHWMFGITSDIAPTYAQGNFWGFPQPDPMNNPLRLALHPFTSPVGWYNGVNPVRLDMPGTLTLDSRSPVGAYDMVGNVSELCHDTWHTKYETRAAQGVVSNPCDSASSHSRMRRGGGHWDSYYTHWLRAARRESVQPEGRYSTMGFRVCVSGSVD